ncbi:MAG: cytochrome P450 [Acidimicrobiales bacterium]
MSWIAALDRWLVTSRERAIDVLRDPASFTVEDPRFSTGQVLGPSMLSLDGPEHRRHRSPFTELAGQDTTVQEEATRHVETIAPRGRAELRTELAGPYAASVIARVLGLDLVTTRSNGNPAGAVEVLTWYRAIVAAVTEVDAGRAVAESAIVAIEQLRDTVGSAAASPNGFLARPAAALASEELFSNVAVLLFGAIETVEAMITNALHHLLTNPAQHAAVEANPTLLAGALEESLRLEPGAAIVDRYTTRPVVLGGTTIPAGDLVSVSLTGANRDPRSFPDPDRFDPERTNASRHLAFVTGPHACLGARLARAEAMALITTLIARCPKLTIDPSASDAPSGFIFRKPARLTVTWTLSRDRERP